MGKNFLINYQGQKLTLTEIARMNHVGYVALRNQYQQTGDIEQALEMTKKAHMGPRQYIDFFGEKRTINQIAKIYGINYQNLHITYKLTSDIDEAITLALNKNFIYDGEKKYCEYQSQENTESIHKLKNLTYTINEAGLKTDHTLLNNSVEPISTAEDKIFIEGMKKQFSTLPARWQQVLHLRYGFDDNGERTLDEVATLFGLSYERVRQLENQAIRKLRHPKRAGYYSAYPDETEKFIVELKREIALMSLVGQRVVCLLYGLVDGQFRTYTEIAKEVGLTPIQVKSIEKLVMEKLPYCLSCKCEERRSDLEASFLAGKSKNQCLSSI